VYPATLRRPLVGRSDIARTNYFQASGTSAEPHQLIVRLYIDLPGVAHFFDYLRKRAARLACALAGDPAKVQVFPIISSNSRIGTMTATLWPSSSMTYCTFLDICFSSPLSA
jgi:hypothetical protein